jgi:hypothetical protein
MVLGYRHVGFFVHGNISKEDLIYNNIGNVFARDIPHDGFKRNYFLFSGVESERGTSPIGFFGGHPLWF